MYNVEFIENLRSYIYRKTGKTYFSNIRDGREDILVSCPIHKDGQERHPSCGFLKVNKEEASAGTFHCFSCGFTGDTHSVLKHILGDLYDKKEVDNIFDLEELDFQARASTTSFMIKIPKEEKFIDKQELNQYRYYTDYLANRKITEDTANKYDIGFDVRTNEITFPIRDRFGRCLAIGRRSVLGKRYEYPKGFQKPLYGIYELPPIISNFYVWICEGPFNLWSLHQYGKLGVGLLGTGTQNQLEQLLTINCKGFVLALDGDEAGRKGNTKIANFLINNKRKVFVAYIPDYKDVNDMTEDEFINMEVESYYTWKIDIDKRLNNKN